MCHSRLKAVFALSFGVRPEISGAAALPVRGDTSEPSAELRSENADSGRRLRFNLLFSRKRKAPAPEKEALSISTAAGFSSSGRPSASGSLRSERSTIEPKGASSALPARRVQGEHISKISSDGMATAVPQAHTDRTSAANTTVRI